MDHEAEPGVDLCQVSLLPAEGSSQRHQCAQECRGELGAGGQAEQPTEIINKDKAPIDLGKKVVGLSHISLEQDPLAVLGGPVPGWGWVVRVPLPVQGQRLLD